MMYTFKRFGTVRSKNIIAVHPYQHNHVNVIFTAHYDSKSQTFSGVARFVLFGFLLVFVLLSMLLIFAELLLSLDTSYLFITLVPMTVTAILLQINASHNRSPGAYDNASGVGVMLELAQTFAAEMPDVNLVWIATGAEEAGLCGAVALMNDKTFIDRFPPHRTIIVNFDGIGSGRTVYITDKYGIPPARTGKLLSTLCMRIGNKFGIPIRRHWLPSGAAMDHIPFAYHGYQSVTLSSAALDAAFKSMHTHSDTVDHLSVAALEYCYAIGQEIIESIPSVRELAALN